ncbi:hypothetical protein QR680_014658 [Steinernema hermaphroditum]|uniref:Uncharacterized protein n=1 Tax=Steinernema hermaphroditum TaxID=289476 RepID=A0AA39I9Q8_9BILA|nr:hypothetical protein QR680_014658 [Steinernema hermaphroditum]
MSGMEFNVNEGVPPDDAVNDQTITEDANQEVVGQNTAELSDVSEQDDEPHASSVKAGRISTWYRRITPLVRNRRVRYFAILNFILTLLNLVLFSATVGFFAWYIFNQVTINRELSQDRPCLYAWSEWTFCSATCATVLKDGTVRYPTRTRHVVPDKVVHSRGDKYKKCPPNVESMTESVPCNTPRCAVPLSSFTTWTECFYKNPLTYPDKNATGCYRIRKMPRDNYYVHIDTDVLTQDCSPRECLKYMP